MLYYVSIFFTLLAILAFFIKKPLLQPIVFIMYGTVSLILAVYQSSNWLPIFMLRFFLMIISSFIIIVLPVLLLLIILLLANNMLQKNHSFWQKLQHFIIILALITFLIYTVWGSLNIELIDYERFLNLYSTVSLYFTSLFISYIVITLFIHFWPQRSKSSALVILGSEVGDDGKIFITLKRRLDYSLKVYYKSKPSTQKQMKFIVTGGKATAYRGSEADYMANYLIANGIEEEQIIIEPSANNTHENFVFVQEILNKAKIEENVLVITSKFHLVRAYYFAWKTQVKAYFNGSTTPLYLWPYSLVREYIAFVILTKEINFLFFAYLMLDHMYQLIF